MTKRIYLFLIITASWVVTLPAFATGFDSVGIYGFISQGYLISTRNDFIENSKDGTFEFNEIGLNFGYQPIDRMLVSIQLFARDFGSTGNDKVTVDFAYAGYRITDYLGIRAGKMKNPMGLYSETRDVDLLRTCIFLPFSVYDELLRNSQTYVQGVSVHGDISLNRFGSFSYQALVGGNNISEDSPDADFLELGITDISSVDIETVYSYSVQYTDPTSTLRLGGSAYFTTLNVGAVARDHLYWYANNVAPGAPLTYKVNNIEIYTGSVELTWGNLVAAYELKYTKARNLRLWDEAATYYDEPMDQYAYYGMVSYRINEYLEVCVYRDEFFPYKYDRKGHNPLPGFSDFEHWLKKWAFSIRIDVNPSWIVKFETQYVDGAAYMIYEDNKKAHWFINAAKLTYNF